MDVGKGKNGSTRGETGVGVGARVKPGIDVSTGVLSKLGFSSWGFQALFSA
jgi:hypothetical protein